MSSADDFGHFRLPLTLNKGNIDVKVAERLFATTNRYLSRFTESRPEHYANWNLLGMLSFRLGQFEEALLYLDKVLSPDEDPDNLNALANRKYICEKLYRFTEARDCQQRIARLLRQDDTEEGTRRLRKLRARSISERAFAFKNGIYEESVTTKRYRKSFDLYQAAIELAKEDVGQSEREDWIFESGSACRLIYNKIKWDKSKNEEVKQFYQDAVNSFITIVQISEDKDRKSSAWRHLGDLFKQPGNLLPSIPDTYQVFVEEPGKCFEEALSLTPNDSRVLTRQAKHFIKTDQTEALIIINRAIEIDSSEFNPRAREVRANIYLSKYKKQLKEDYEFRHPDDTLLVQAKKDLSFAIKDVSKPWSKESMAEVLYYMATNRGGFLKPGSEVHLQQALTYCAKAVESADGAKRAYVHKLRGMCLCATGEHQAALGSYKRALECEIAYSYPVGSAGALVSEYKHILPDNHSVLREDLYLLGDMKYWLHNAACICLETNWDLWQVKTLEQMSDHWAIFVKYCKDNGYERELEDIELSADKKGRSGLQQPFPLRHVRYDTARSTQGRNQNHSPASSAGGAASRVCDASSRSHEKQYQKQPHSQRKQLTLPVSVEEGSLSPSVTERQQSFQASSTTTYDQPPYRAQREQLSDEKRDDIDVDNLSKSLAAVQLDKNAAASDTVQVTYTVNVKTGKVVQSPIVPSSSSERCAENAPRKHIKPGPAKPFNRQYKYDFFVIYASSALEWVEHSMLEELEGTGSLLGCVKDRDFSLGKPTLLNYSDSIEKSACTIVVVTKDLEVDSLCCHAMFVALEQGGLVIPVLKEARDMPVFLRPFTHLDATGAVDWRRLERSIEQRIRPET